MPAKKAITKNETPNPVGRPRKVSFSEEEMISLGQEMVDWVKSNDPIHLSQWYTIHKGFIYNEWKTFIQRKEFIPYYEVSMRIIGLKYLDGDNKRIKEGLCQRWQRVYFADLVDQEDKDMDRAAERQQGLNKDSAMNLATLYEKIRLGEIKISQSDLVNAGKRDS